MIENLAMALKKRGFLIELKDNHIYFSTGNHEGELNLLEKMFKELNINVNLTGRNIFLLQDHLTEDKLRKIIWYEAINHEAGGGTGWRGWKYFKKRKHGPKINTFSLETGVALLVKALSASGITTICSCHGHGTNNPLIAFCGQHNAIWFRILFNEVKENFKLNYEWYFYNTNFCDPSFAAKSIDGSWELKKIQEDTLQIAEYFLNESERLSNVKREIFGRNYKSTRKMIHEMNYDQLFDWMESKYNHYLLSQRIEEHSV